MADNDSVNSEAPLLNNEISFDASEPLEENSQAAVRIDSAIKSTDTAIQSFEQFEEEIKVSYIKSRKVRVAGLLMTIISSFFAIAGFFLGFVTFEASIALISFGAVLSTIGAIVIGAAEVWYMTVTRSVMRNVKVILCQFTTGKFEELARNTDSDHCDCSANVIFPNRKISIKMERGSCKPQNKPMARTVFCSCKVFDGVSDVILTIILAITRATAGSSVQISVRTLWKELGVAMRAIGIGVTILDGLFIPIDIFVLIKSVYDICKYNKGYGSNSCAAKEINSLIEEFKQQKRDLEHCQSEATFHILKNN